MITFDDILSNCREDRLEDFFNIIERLDDTCEEFLYILDHFPRCQTNEEMVGNDIFFECMEEENFDASRYYTLLYKYKSFINVNLSNCSLIYTNFTSLHTKSVTEVLGIKIKTLSKKKYDFLEFTSNPYFERVLDLSFADKVLTILVCKKFECVLFISGFSCACYIFDETHLIEMKKRLELDGLYIWKKII